MRHTATLLPRLNPATVKPRLTAQSMTSLPTCLPTILPSLSKHPPSHYFLPFLLTSYPTLDITSLRWSSGVVGDPTLHLRRHFLVWTLHTPTLGSDQQRAIHSRFRHPYFPFLDHCLRVTRLLSYIAATINSSCSRNISRWSILRLQLSGVGHPARQTRRSPQPSFDEYYPSLPHPTWSSSSVNR